MSFTPEPVNAETMNMLHQWKVSYPAGFSEYQSTKTLCSHITFHSQAASQTVEQEAINPFYSQQYQPYSTPEFSLDLDSPPSLTFLLIVKFVYLPCQQNKLLLCNKTIRPNLHVNFKNKISNCN